MSIISRAELDCWLHNEDTGKTQGWTVADSLTQKLEGVFVGYQGEAYRVVSVRRVDDDLLVALVDDQLDDIKEVQLLDPDLLLSIPPDGFYQHPDVGVYNLYRRTLRQWKLGLCRQSRSVAAIEGYPPARTPIEWGYKAAKCVLYPQYGGRTPSDPAALSLHYLIAGKLVYHRDVGLVGSVSKDIITLYEDFSFLKEELMEAAGDGYHIRVV